jgi:hypothetical protein
MTQVNVDRRAGMRKIQRVEGLTNAEKMTKDYVDRVIEFVKSVESVLTQAEVELRLLGEPERGAMQDRIDNLLRAMQPTVREFMAWRFFFGIRK